MPGLSVALEDGFADDAVIVRVNDQEVFNKTNIKTRSSIGLANRFDVEVAEGSVIVETTLPLKQVSESITLQVAKPTLLGISITADGQISYRTAEEPFGYG